MKDQERDESPFVGHEPCPACGSRDNLARYASGRAHCHGCGHNEFPDGSRKTFTPRTPAMTDYKRITGEYRGLSNDYGLSLDTCKRLDIQIVRIGITHLEEKLPRKDCIAFGYKSEDGTPWGQKVRYVLDETTGEKTFRFPNAGGHRPLYLQHMWGPGTDLRTICVFEGEGDCAAYFQITGGSKACVSVTTGAKGGLDDIRANLEFLQRFERIVICFDADETGRQWAKEAAKLLPAGRAYIAETRGHKDAREVLLKGDAEAKKAVQWMANNAEQFKPDGIFTLKDIRQAVLTPPEQGRPWFDDRLTKLTYGRRPGEVYLFGAGTAVGKTDFFTQSIAFDVLELKVKTGVIYLEQPPAETGKRIAGKVAGKAFHIPDGSWEQSELEATIDMLDDTGCLFLGGNFAATDWDSIESRIRFMKHSLGVEHLYLDNLTALTDPKDEQASVAQVIKDISLLAQELGLVDHVISHLATPEGKSHEEGGKVLPKHFRGSRALQYWAHYMFGLERNTQSEDPEEILHMILRCVKDRYTGRASGKTLNYRYDQASCQLMPSEPFVASTPGIQVQDYSALHL